ncbi:hypothetical protein AB0D38_22805 [Streptomyces sp. NPDC048279]|uniref:hypothetical protein n=1 Tax=Streptomyces sp. NPDC048279 TaxID=3154714 RepID=UPI00343A3196
MSALSTPPSDGKAAKFARSFLDRWSERQLNDAAADTDVRATAISALHGHTHGLHLKSVSFGQVTAVGPSSVTRGATKVTFDVTARAAGGTWTCPSAVADGELTRGRSPRWSHTL